jgi:DNA (cytosine-5)-methyltransferase 1
MNKKNGPVIAAVDLFCGAGGLTKGLEDAGIEVRLGVDLDPACEYPYERNTRAMFLGDSVEKIRGKELRAVYDGSDYKLLAGCAPCQPFSTYAQGWTDPSDHRWGLLGEFGRLVEEANPDLVTMENVPRLQYQQVFQDFVERLQDLGFKVSYKTVNCAGYGVPQQRERLVLLASKLGPIDMVKPSRSPSRFRTVRQAIKGMPIIRAGSASEKDPLHKAAGLSDTNRKRIKASKPGGTWRDWDTELIAECHTKKTGKTYPGVYGRMRWDEPAPTVTTQFFGFGNGRFGHPTQARAISLREGAILQSFPRSYKFCPPGQEVECKSTGRLIGNAVPVKLGKAIGRSVREHIEALG